MNIYEVTQWSRVPCERAYVEAETEAGAITALAAEFDRDDPNGADDRLHQDEWRATLMKRPICIVAWKD